MRDIKRRFPLSREASAEPARDVRDWGAGEKVQRNLVEPRHFKPWVEFAREAGYRP